MSTDFLVPISEDKVTIRFLRPGNKVPKIENWTSYSFETDFFYPCASFSFECSDDRADQLRDTINISDPVELLVNGVVECKGLIEKIDFSYNVSGGSTIKLSGRDILGVVIDGTIDPKIKISETQTFGYALKKAFETAGFDEDHISFVNVNPNKVMQTKQTTKQSKPASGRSTTAKVNAQMKPHKNEGFMEFAMRICKRSGWNIKLSPDGEWINIGMPDYSSHTNDPSLFHEISMMTPANNILDGSISCNWQKMPSYIIGEATGAGGVNRKGLNKVFVPNTVLLDQEQIIFSIYSTNYNKMKFVEDPVNQLSANLPTMLKNLFPGIIQPDDKPAMNLKLRPLYLYDDESKSLSSLEYVMRKKMADFQNNFFQVNYTVSGHSYMSHGMQVNYAIDTMCKVKDDTYGFDNSFWIQKRVFTKSRSAGTKTHLTLKLPYIYVFPDIL